MKVLLRYLEKAEHALLIGMFLVMLAASFAQVINRNLIHASIGWFEELARYCMIYMALLATELGLRDNTQMSITAAVDRMPPKARKAALITARLVIIAFSGVLFCNSFDFIKAQFAFGQFSPGLNLPMYIPYFALPLSFGIIAVVQTALLGRMLCPPREEPSDKEEST